MAQFHLILNYLYWHRQQKWPNGIHTKLSVFSEMAHQLKSSVTHSFDDSIPREKLWLQRFMKYENIAKPDDSVCGFIELRFFYSGKVFYFIIFVTHMHARYSKWLAEWKTLNGSRYLNRNEYPSNVSSGTVRFQDNPLNECTWKPQGESRGVIKSNLVKLFYSNFFESHSEFPGPPSILKHFVQSHLL